jgi:hypothetical protein
LRCGKNKRNLETFRKSLDRKGLDDPLSPLYVLPLNKLEDGC